MSYRKYHIKNKIHRIKPQKPIFVNLWFWIVILIIIIFLTLVYFLFFYPGFQVQNIIISGNQKVETLQLQNVVSREVNRKIFALGPIRVFSKSILFVDKNSLTTGLLKDFPAIDTLAIKIKFPHTLALDIFERKPVGIFCPSTGSGQASERCFFVDGAGIIFEELSGIPDNMFIVRQEKTNGLEAVEGQNAVGQDVIDAILKIQKELTDKFKINIKEALVATPIRLDIKTGEGWQIYFDLSSGLGIDMQVAKLNLLLKNDITPQVRKTLQYIDLRFKDRAYYK